LTRSRARSEAGSMKRVARASCCCWPTVRPTVRFVHAWRAPRRRLRRGRRAPGHRAGGAACPSSRFEAARADAVVGSAHPQLDAEAADRRHHALVDAAVGRAARRATHPRRAGLEARRRATASPRTLSAIQRPQHRRKSRRNHRAVSGAAPARRGVLRRRKDGDSGAGSARSDPAVVPGRAERHGFEYIRHGTLSLYAALDTQTGLVMGQPAARHTSEEFVSFLATVAASQQATREIHTIADNLSAHKTALVTAFLDRHPR
jgi:hypothetical protein